MKKMRTCVSLMLCFVLLLAIPLNASAEPVKAYSTRYEGKRAVLYLNDNNHNSYYLVGGTRSWRNHNPGNLHSGSFSNEHGAIGTDYSGFAIFPSYSRGFSAMKSLVSTTYKNHTIATMMKDYAPPEENDTAAYISYLEKETGMSRDKKIGEMNSKELNSLLEAMIKHEGYKVGEKVFVGTA